MHRPQDELDLGEDRTGALAARFGVDTHLFAEVFGTGWTESPDPPWHDFDADPSGGLDGPVTPYHVSGEPPVLMLHVFQRHLWVGIPEGQWRGGTHDLRYHLTDRLHLHAEDVVRDARLVTAAVEGLAARRLAEISWCPTCRHPFGRERLIAGPGSRCHGCATAIEGMVY